jgi:UDP-glucose 4,6-dehydratase
MADSFVPHNILLTGGAGFIGSHVARFLATEHPEYDIVVLDKLDYCASRSNVPENCRFVLGDINDADLVRDVLASNKIDTIMHFAAQTHVDNSFGNSLSFTLNNVLGTHVLLEAARAMGPGVIKRFVNVSTDEVYGDESLGQEEGSTEASVLEPTNPYSAAKAGAEMLCKAYLRSYGLPIIVTRGNNVYGPGQYPEKLVPKFILLAAQGRPLPIHGDGGSVRSFLYVEDVARAFAVILHRGRVGEVYNIGTSDERTVLQVAKDVRIATKASEDVAIEYVNDRAFNDRRYFIGSEKLQALGWEPQVSWDDGLARTVEWYLDETMDVKHYWGGGDLEVALQPHPQPVSGL